MKNTTELTKVEQLKKTIVDLRQIIDVLKKSKTSQLKKIGENLPEGGF